MRMHHVIALESRAAWRSSGAVLGSTVYYQDFFLHWEWIALSQLKLSAQNLAEEIQ
jgi:hypothetical protein